MSETLHKLYINEVWFCIKIFFGSFYITMDDSHKYPKKSCFL